jgi:antitoxin component YwqK of YwqJK toxin-antitoxin module
MAQKVLLLFRTICLLIIAISTFSCNKAIKEESKLPSSFVVTTSMIPKDTILSDNKNLKLNNGIYYLNEKTYSGYIKEMYNEKQIKNVFSFLNGQQQGLSICYYLDGKIKDSRSYKEGKSYGRHFGYWENGNQKYDFIYANDKREGLQKQWYESGTPYSFLTFKDDKEDGMQKAWRQNGKPYINYQAKDGHRYGLQKSNLCYTLRDGKLKSNKE